MAKAQKPPTIKHLFIKGLLLNLTYPTCTLILTINGTALPANTVSGGPLLCQANSNNTPNPNQCYQPDRGDTLVITRIPTPGETTLSTSIASPSILALSVNNPLLNPALTGNARQITIQNTGTNEARGLDITYPAWPGGTPATTASSTCGATLAAGASCTITVVPGSDPTSGCNTGSAPTPGTITVSATNVGTPVTSDVVVLSYGCQYQSGFLYSVNDMTPNTGSIGGKVAGLVNVSNNNRWTNAGGTNIPGAESNIDGIQNTDDIIADPSCTTSTVNCAAYQCRNNFTAGGFTDWYLPAICEEGYDRTNNNSGCGSVGAPTIQNMQSNLVDNGNVGSLSLFYWSSTELSSSPDNFAWNQFFFSSGGSVNTSFDKTVESRVRCSRALIP